RRSPLLHEREVGARRPPGLVVPRDLQRAPEPPKYDVGQRDILRGEAQGMMATPLRSLDEPFGFFRFAERRWSVLRLVDPITGVAAASRRERKGFFIRQSRSYLNEPIQDAPEVPPDFVTH